MSHNENWKAFGSSFFRVHQNKLLWLLNNPVLGYWFRYVLRINGRRSDLGKNKVWRIHPNSVFWREGEKTVAEFRTHPKFAKRLYYAFRPFWDLVLAFRVLPYEQDGYLFGKSGFVRRQPLLLYLLNGPLKHWFRWVLRINGDRSSVGNREIIQILPHAIWWREGKEYHAEFRTHAKYSKRVFYAFRYLWEAMHFWDWLIADRLLPSLSFRFNNYTAYPDPDPETSTVDGQVEEWPTNTTFAALRTGTGTGAFPNVSGPGDNCFIIKSNVSTDVWDGLGRSIFLFDTSAITGAATINSGTFSLFSDSKFDYLSTSPSLALVSSAPASNTNLVAGDFDSLGSTEFATRIAYASVTTAAYNNMSLNSSGLSAISKTGVTKYGVREGEFDLDGGTPTWASNTSCEVNAYYADYTGTANDPKLVVAYTLASGATITAYPDADPETTTIDGEVFEGRGYLSGISWATMIGGAGTGELSNSATNTGLFILSDGAPNTDLWRYCVRWIMLFDTSPLGASATISAATVSLYGVSKQDTGSYAPSVNIYTSAPASNNALVGGDYDSLGSTALSDTVSFANLSTTGYQDFTLNATGRGEVSKTGVTKLGMRNTEYDVGATPPTWQDNKVSEWVHDAADQTGTSTDPKLVVAFTYERNPGAGSVGMGGVSPRMDLGVGVPSTIWGG